MTEIDLLEAVSLKFYTTHQLSQLGSLLKCTIERLELAAQPMIVGRHHHQRICHQLRVCEVNRPLHMPMK